MTTLTPRMRETPIFQDVSRKIEKNVLAGAGHTNYYRRFPQPRKKVPVEYIMRHVTVYVNVV